MPPPTDEGDPPGMPPPTDEGAGSIQYAAGVLQRATSGFQARMLDG
jgi:hypothetical protein